MTASGFRSAGPTRPVLALALAAGLLVASCSASGAAPTPAGSVAAATATAVVTAVPTKGPATQTLTLVGPAGAAGAVTNAAIRCNEPATDGTLITVLGRPADPNLSVYIFVQPGKVTVRYDSGSGSKYIERDFAGTGVSGFDAATGAQLDSQLTEVPSQTAHGSLGVLTSISGSIDCGNQLPGSSTLTFSGPTPKGDISGGLNPVNVVCNVSSTASSVSVLGLGQVGSTTTLVIISVSPGAFTWYSGGNGFFRSTPTAVATLTTTGAHLEGDAIEQMAAGSKAKPHTIHVSGDLICGTTFSS